MCGGPGMPDPRAGGDATDSSQTALDNKASLLHSMPAHSSPRARDYNPYNYSDSLSPFNKSALKEAMFDDDADQFPDGRFWVILCHLCFRELLISEQKKYTCSFIITPKEVRSFGMGMFLPSFRSSFVVVW